MKLLSILVFFLFFLANAGIGQSLNVVRNLGKVNFANSADLVLSAKVESGKYTYTLTDIKVPETPVFSFALVSNSVEVFKESIKAKLAETGKQIEVTDPVLEKYFFFFENQNPFLIADSEGGEAMEMTFSDTLTIFNFKHKVYSQIKKEDVLKLLNSLINSTMSIEDFEKKDAFNIDTYKNLEIRTEKEDLIENTSQNESSETHNETSTVEHHDADETSSGSDISEENNIDNSDSNSLSNGQSTPPNLGNPNLKIFESNEFEARLFEIEKGTPKPLRWEELYKEIQYRYYKALIKNIESKIDTAENSANKTIKQLQLDISAVQSNRKELIRDTTILKKDIRDKTLLIASSKAKVLDLNNRIQSDLELYVFPENWSQDDESINAYFDSAFQANFTIARNLGDQFRITPKNIENISERDSSNIVGIFKSDLNKVQQKGFNIRGLNLENIKISELETVTSQNESLLITKEKLLIPVVGALKLKLDSLANLQNEVLEKIKSELNALKNSNKFHFKAREIQMEFNRGYLENIVVVGEATIFIEPALVDFKSEIPFPALTLKFVNEYPIGISAKKDIERLGDIKLYARYQDQVHYELRIGDLITNIKEILALDRTDYSPLDGTVLVDLLTEKNKELKKSPTKEILQLKVFSDFVGLQEENPNGLIQFEVDKEIPLVTKRLTKPYLGPIRFLVNKSGNAGFFNFFRPRFIFSKIEDNNSSLQLTSLPNEAADSTRFGTSTLAIKQFERFSIGTDLNLFLLNIPYGKSTFLINAGMYFGRTDFAEIDSIPTIKRFPRAYTNTYQPSTELLWRITGDERYGIELSYGITWVISDQFNFTQRANTFDATDFDSLQKSDKKYGIQRFMILAYLNLDSNSSGRMFFRYRSNSELGNFKNNFSQLQVGYTTYLTRTSK